MHSKYGSLVEETAFGEAAETGQRRIDQICLASENQITENLSRCWGMHHAVSAETVGKEKAGHTGCLAQDGMMVRRHFIESSPCALGIHRKIGETGNTVGSASEDFLHKGFFKIGLESRGLFRIVPCKQKTARFGTKMESVRHVDDHWSRVR